MDIFLDGLTNRDHQIASATIGWLNSCQIRHEFNEALKTVLLPLLACNGVFYVRLIGEKDALHLLGSINQSGCCQHSWEIFLDTVLQKLTAENSITDNVNVPLPIHFASIVHCIADLNCEHHSFGQSCQQSHHNDTAITVFDDDHQPAYRFYFCRLNKQQQIFSQRDIELLKILRPALLQALRLILFREEKLNSRQVLNFWSDNTDPIIVIRDDGAIIFQSRTFEQVIAQDKHTFLSTVSALVKTVQRDRTGWYSFLSKLGKRLYEIRLTLINADINYRQCIYLLHLSRVTHKIGKIFSQLNRTGLTNRELEIAMLIYQGNSPREIAGEINLSYHTVRNHIKSIYSKLGVSTRSEMLVRFE